MRRANLSAEEILKAEKAVDDRRNSRKRGYSKMHERDAGFAHLSNGVDMLWPVPEIWSEEVGGISTLNVSKVPEGYFVLKLGEKTWLFNTEEFRRHLRWA